jgi:hypothetical protein
LQLLIWVRNGVIHAGQVEADADVLVPFLRASEHLLAEMLDADRETFWGDSLEVVDARLSQSTDAARVSAADALAAAKRRFAERYSEVEPALQSAMISTVEDTYAPEKYEQTLWTCPACEHPGTGVWELRRQLGAQLRLLGWRGVDRGRLPGRALLPRHAQLSCVWPRA